MGRPGQSLLWCVPRHTLALTGRWLWGQAVLPQGALCLSQCLCLHLRYFSVSLTPWGHRVKTCLCVCVLIKEGFLEESELELPRGQERA